MGFIGDLWSIPNTFISAAQASAASGKAFGRQLYAMEHQAKLNYNYGQRSLRESPKAQREGLVNAGFNPMLAVQNATSGANAGWSSGTSVAQDDISGITSANASSAQAFNSMDNLNKQTDSTVATNEAIADANYANADKAKAEKATLMERMPWISKREKAEIGNIEKDSLKKEAEIHNIDETTRFIEKDYALRQKLGMMGIDVQRRGQDKLFAGTVYNADTNERNNMRSNRVNTSLEHIRHPYSSFAHKSYTSGKGYKSSGSYRDPWLQ